MQIQCRADSAELALERRLVFSADSAELALEVTLYRSGLVGRSQWAPQNVIVTG